MRIRLKGFSVLTQILYLGREVHLDATSSMHRTNVFLFVLHLLTRVAFALALGWNNNYTLQVDSHELVRFGLQASTGDFNFELDRFIVSPLFSSVVALFKILFGDAWATLLLCFQLLLSALSGVYIFKIALLLFQSRKIGLLASLLFAVFPLTLWFTHTFSQECLFQAFFIFSLYHLIAALERKLTLHVCYAAVFFGLAYLTKSHILIFSLFIPLMFYHVFKFSKTTVWYTILFASISIAFSVPYGLYTYKKHGTYVLSSNGAAYQFYLGNTDAGYKTIVDVPPVGTADYLKMKDITVHAGYFNGSDSIYNATLLLPQPEKQATFYRAAREWIAEHPQKFIELKAYNLALFFLPGVSWRHYPFRTWLATFLICLPVYMLAYFALVRMLKARNPRVVPLVYVMLSMVIFSTVWYVQNRFRTITLEPLYLVYAALPLWELLQRKRWGHQALDRLDRWLNAPSLPRS